LKLTDGTVSVTDDTGFEIAELSKLGTDASLEIQSYVDPSKASFCGPEAPQNASYTWKLDGNTLTLSAVEDRCAPRSPMLTGAWKRSAACSPPTRFPRRAPAREPRRLRSTGAAQAKRRLRALGYSPTVPGSVPEWLKGTGCKPVGIAYVGSNPTAPM